MKLEYVPWKRSIITEVSINVMSSQDRLELTRDLIEAMVKNKEWQHISWVKEYIDQFKAPMAE